VGRDEGISHALARSMTTRCWPPTCKSPHDVRLGGKGRIKLEPKDKMKKRLADMGLKATHQMTQMRLRSRSQCRYAANAKARATQQVSKGRLSPSSAAKIRAKANRILNG
jgi:hypothetical protein